MKGIRRGNEPQDIREFHFFHNVNSKRAGFNRVIYHLFSGFKITTTKKKYWNNAVSEDAAKIKPQIPEGKENEQYEGSHGKVPFLRVAFQHTFSVSETPSESGLHVSNGGAT